MISEYRKRFNASFNSDAYRSMCERVQKEAGKPLDFRVAETPVFVPNRVKEEMIATCEYILDFISSADFENKTASAIPDRFSMEKSDNDPSFLVFDFAITKNENQELKPALIELQGFPSLFAFQHLLDRLYREHFDIPVHCDSYLSGYQPESYVDLLKNILVGNEDLEEVVLMDLEPSKQKTAIDFVLTEKMTGIKSVCINEIIQENQSLFYLRDGKKTRIKRIFNRFVPDEWNPSIKFDFKNVKDVEWLNHPHDYFRISKFILPFLSHPCIPETHFLPEFSDQFPLSDSVLKPLFSFGGNGVMIDVEAKDINNIQNQEQWIIQKKMRYADVIETTSDAAKTEIRIFYFRPKKGARPIPVHNLARISKGSMIGTRFNTNKDWVGGSIAYFDQA